MQPIGLEIQGITYKMKCVFKHTLTYVVWKKKKNTFFNILRSYGEITKYGLRPLAGSQLGLRVFEDNIKVAFWYQYWKKNHSVEYGRDITKSELRPLPATE